MVNKVNVQKAIDIMERVPNDMLNMRFFQSGSLYGTVTTEEALHACGNKACFAGYIAVSPEFKADGGKSSWSGAPRLTPGDNATDSISKWLDIDLDLAESFVFGDSDTFYPVPWTEVKPQHVIAKLKELLKTE